MKLNRDLLNKYLKNNEKTGNQCYGLGFLGLLEFSKQGYYIEMEYLGVEMKIKRSSWVTFVNDILELQRKIEEDKC